MEKLSRPQIEGKNHNIKIANRSFENAAKINYFGMLVTCQNLIHEEITSILNLDNACYLSVQSLSSRMVSKNVKQKIL
jgi:hypothetical protein